MLERLLRKVALQETGGLFDLSVVVVDNDAEGPARETVMRLNAELGLDISYAVSSRNRRFSPPETMRFGLPAVNTPGNYKKTLGLGFRKAWEVRFSLVEMSLLTNCN